MLINRETTNTTKREAHMKRKKAVGGLLGMFGSFTFLNLLDFFGFGSVVVAFFLYQITNQIISISLHIQVFDNRV